MKNNFENYVLFDLMRNPHEELRNGFLADCPFDPELFSSIHFGDIKFCDEVSKYLTKAKFTSIGYSTPDYFNHSPLGKLAYRNDNYVFYIRSQTKPKNIFTTSSRVAITHFYSNPQLSKGITRYLSRIDYTDYSEFMVAKEKCMKKSSIPDYPFKEVQINADGVYCDGGDIRYRLFFDYKSSKDGIIGMVTTNYWSIYSYYGLV